MSSAINFVYLLITTESLSIPIRIIIGNVALPLGVFLWNMDITQLVFDDYKKLLLRILILIGINFEISLFYGLIFKIEFIVDINSHLLSTNYTLPMNIFQLFFSVCPLVIGLVFSFKFIRHVNQEIKFRGKIFFLAFTYFLVGAILGLFDQFIIRNINMIPSSILFYLGYILWNS